MLSVLKLVRVSSRITCKDISGMYVKVFPERVNWADLRTRELPFHGPGVPG